MNTEILKQVNLNNGDRLQEKGHSIKFTECSEKKCHLTQDIE